MKHKLIMENWRRFVNESQNLRPEWWRREWETFTDNMREKYPDVYYKSGVLEAAIASAKSQNIEHGSQTYYITVLEYIKERYPEEWEGSRINTSIVGDLSRLPRDEVPDAPVDQVPPEPAEEPEGGIQILSPILQGSEKNYSNRQMVVVKTPSYGNITFYYSTGGGTGVASRNMWLPSGGIGMKYPDDTITMISKMTNRHPEACIDDAEPSCLNDDGELITGKMPKVGSEFRAVGDFIEENGASVITTMAYAKSGQVPDRIRVTRSHPKRGITDISDSIPMEKHGVQEFSDLYESAVINHFLQSHGAQLFPENFASLTKTEDLPGITDIIKLQGRGKITYHKFKE